MKTILITGGSGLVGKPLTQFLIDKGHSVRILTTSKSRSEGSNQFYYWNIPNQEIDEKALEGVTDIIHLAGSTVAQRWTNKAKQEILESRVEGAKLLLTACKKQSVFLDAFISASGANYYGTVTQEIPFTEEQPSGSDFLAQVCQQWEAAADSFEGIAKRVVKLRTGVVLTPKGGMIPKLLPIFKWNLGSAIGSGKQYLPWIAIEDLVTMYDFVLFNENCTGAYNAVHPQKITNSSFSKIFAKTLGKFFIPISVPSFVLKMVLGEMSEILLEGSPLSTQKIQDMGFTYQYDSVESYLAKIL